MGVKSLMSKLQGNKVKVQKDVRAGIEIEFTGVNRKYLARYLVNEGYFVESREEIHIVAGSERTRIRMRDKRDKDWYLVVDKSIAPVITSRLSGDYDTDYMCELVSPVLEGGKDWKFLFNVLREIEFLGGVVNETCGIHIHVDAPEDTDKLKRVFTKLLSSQEKIEEKLNIQEYRLNKYTKVYPKEFCQEFSKKNSNIKTKEDLLEFVYSRLGEGVSRDDEKNPARYYMLNMDSIHKRNTIEFRMFNSTLDMGVIAGYLEWVHNFMD